MASTVPWGVISTLPNKNKSKESKEKGVSSAYSTEINALINNRRWTRIMFNEL